MKFCLTEAGMCEITQLPYKLSCTQNINHIERILEKVRSGVKIVVEHIERHKVVYRVGAMTLVLFIGLDVTAFADSGIDANAEKLYKKLLGIGKWVVIIKGAFDTISSTVQGDFVAARKAGISYLLVFVILLGLPWAFNQIEALFEEVT